MGRNANKIDPHDKFSGLATSDYNNKFTITGEAGTKLKSRRCRVLKGVGAFLLIPISVAATIALVSATIYLVFASLLIIDMHGFGNKIEDMLATVGMLTTLYIEVKIIKMLVRVCRNAFSKNGNSL